MPSSFSFGNLRFDLSPTPGSRGARLEPDAPFRLLVCGDFSGRTQRGLLQPLQARAPIQVDCDNLDKVFIGFQASISVALGKEAPEEIRFQSLEDFHPDHLLARVPSLSRWVKARSRLLDPSTAAEAEREVADLLHQGQGQPTSGPRPESIQNPSALKESTEETLGRLMGRPSPGKAPAPAQGLDLNALIKNIVGPGVPAPAAGAKAALAAVEMELTQRLQALLHHPSFQGLEAAWRELDLWIREYGGDEAIQCWAFDLSRDELAEDLQGDLGQSHFLRTLRSRPWTMVTALYTFEPSLPDLELLARWTLLAAASGAPLVASASSRWAGCAGDEPNPNPEEWSSLSGEVQAAWLALRRLEEADYLGLVWPRLLLRQPYGRESDPIETFAFEEMSSRPAHHHYLWGPGSLAAAWVQAASFREDGWDGIGATSGEVGDLAVHKFREGGETAVKPCAEAWLSERAGERVAALGLIPLLSVKGRGAVQVQQVQSIAEPPRPLAFPRA